MLAEFLNGLVQRVKAAETPTVTKIPGDPRRLIVAHNGVKEFLDVPPADRAHQVMGISDLVTFGQRQDLEAPELFINSERVLIVMKGSDRRETCTMDFQETSRFTRLREMASEGPWGESFTVRDLVRTLRFELPGAASDDLIKALSTIDFSRKSDGSQVAEHGRESLGKRVEKIVQQADRIPESFLVTVPMFNNLGLKHVTATVRVGIYLDMDEESIYLRPLADQLELAMNDVLLQVYQVLHRDLGSAFNDRIYLGTL